MTHSSPANAVCYVERSAVRQILIGSNVNNEDTKDLLQEVDTLPIVTADALNLIRAQPAASPENETTEGYTEGYAASLRQQADLMEKANAGKVSSYVAIDDFDVDGLRDAADFIERIITQQTASPVNAVSDEDWQRALNCAHQQMEGYHRRLQISTEAGRKAALDDCMQHAFGLLSLRIRAQQMPERIPVARPVAFRVPRVIDDKISKTEFRLFDDEDEARRAARDICAAYDGLYLVADRRAAFFAQPDPALTSPGCKS